MALDRHRSNSKEVLLSEQQPERNANSSIPTLEIRLFGQFEVLRDGRAIPDQDWGRRKTRTLLKVLLTNPGHLFTQDQLIDALFNGENVDRARENLYGRVSQLRRALEPGLKRGTDSSFILRKGEGYTFDPTACTSLDTIAFNQSLAESLAYAEEEHWTRAVESFEEAIGLYRGELLAEDRYEAWAEEARAELQRQYLTALVQLSRCYQKLGRLRQAISCCQRVLALEPYREDVIRQLMTFENASGRRANALRIYQEGKEALREHLNVDPSPATKALYESFRQSSEPSALNPNRLAVMPFVSIGSDPTSEFLADGMTEELIYTLSKVGGLEIIAQTSILRFRGTQKSVTEIGQELQVGSLLEGSVQRAQDKARILVQLINVENEAHLWAQQYDVDLDDILEIQADIARKVTRSLEIQLLEKEDYALSKAQAIDQEAHTAYLKGRLFLEKYNYDSYKRAINCFEQALSIAPDYARALTGLADAHLLMVGYIPAKEGYEKAKCYAQQALDLDPASSEIHATLGGIALLVDEDVQKAEEHYLLSIELNPNYAMARESYANLLIHVGRVKEACHQSEIALALDPLDVNLMLTHAESLLASGRLVEAVDQYQKALEINSMLEAAWWGLWFSLAMQWDWDQAEAITRQCVEKYPDNPFAHVCLSQCVVCMGRMREALLEMQKALAVAGDPPNLSILIQAGYSQFWQRDYEKSIEHAQRVLRIKPTSHHAHITLAKCHIQQGRFDEALKELDAAQSMLSDADATWSTQIPMDRGIIYARHGEIEKAEAELATLMGASGKNNRRFSISQLLFSLGRIEESIDWLEDAATAHEPFIIVLGISPEFDPMRSHPRFQALLKRIGLENYARTASI